MAYGKKKVINCTTGAVTEEDLTPAEVAQRDLDRTQAVDFTSTPAYIARGEFNSLADIANKTDAEISAYYDATVTNLASAMVFNKKLARAVAAIARSMKL